MERWKIHSRPAASCTAMIVLLLLTAVGSKAEPPAAVPRITTPVDAFTMTGRGVRLNPDGTWVFSGRRGVYEVDTNGIVSFRAVDIRNLLPAKVVDVYDGDTFTVEIADPPPGIGKEERVRLLGIDTPELDAAGSTPSGKGAWAYPAKDFTASLILSKTVYLAFESTWRDRFSRLLCYAYLADGSLVNAKILNAGYAAVFTDIRCRFQDEFLGLEAEARKAGAGIWKRGEAAGVMISTIHNEGSSEYVELINRSGKRIDISGWKITDADGNSLTIPASAPLAPGAVFRVFSGAAAPPAGPGSIHPTSKQIWNNSGDTANLYDARGALVDSYGY